MTKALYAVFGRFGDHVIDAPGHPFYQIFFLRALAAKFGVDQFDVVFYDDYYDYDIKDEFVVRGPLRKQFSDQLINGIVDTPNSFNNGDYDIVFLKYRFRNYSRLRSGSIDRWKYEQLLETFHDKAVVIDTDAEVKEPVSRIVSLFADPYKYPGNPIVTRMAPVLEDDVYLCNFPPKVDRERLPNKYSFLTFVGNEYFKEGVHEAFREIRERTGIRIRVQGKWNDYPFIDEIIPRTERVKGYTDLAESACSIQISKPVYNEFDFMAPRVFESYLLGTIIFGPNRYMPKFGRFVDFRKDGELLLLSEKIKYLMEVDTATYMKNLKSEIHELYRNLDERLEAS